MKSAVSSGNETSESDDRPYRGNSGTLTYRTFFRVQRRSFCIAHGSRTSGFIGTRASRRSSGTGCFLVGGELGKKSSNIPLCRAGYRVATIQRTLGHETLFKRVSNSRRHVYTPRSLASKIVFQTQPPISLSCYLVVSEFSLLQLLKFLFLKNFKISIVQKSHCLFFLTSK